MLFLFFIKVSLKHRDRSTAEAPVADGETYRTGRVKRSLNDLINPDMDTWLPMLL